MRLLIALAFVAASNAAAQSLWGPVLNVDASSRDAGYLDAVLRACALEPYADELKKSAEIAVSWHDQREQQRTGQSEGLLERHRKAFAAGFADARATAFRNARCDPEYRDRLEKRAKSELRLATEALMRMEAAAPSSPR